MNITTEGPMKHDAPFYVERPLVQRVLNSLENRHYSNIRGGRQTGKTSTAYHVMAFLQAHGHGFAYVDLSQVTDPNISEQTWLARIAANIADTLSPITLRTHVPAPPTSSGQFPTYIYQIVRLLPINSLFILVLDRITEVPENLRILFQTIRTMHDSRSMPGDHDEAERAQFLFVGSFDPDNFIKKNSPLNISKEADFDTITEDFTQAQVSDLVVQGDVVEFADEIFAQTAGHPYLTTSLIKELQVNRDINLAIRRLFRHPHFGLLRRLLEDHERVRARFKRVVEGKQVAYWLGQDDDTDALILRGIVKPNEQDDAIVRCSLYQRWTEQLSFAPRAQYSLVGYVTDALLRTHIEQLIETAKLSVADFPVLVPVCMGVAVESVILYRLEASADLDTWVTEHDRKVRSREFSDSRPIRPNNATSGAFEPLSEWKFVQMINVARVGGLITKGSDNIAHGLRQWRNLVHPAALRNTHPAGFTSQAAEAAYQAGLMLLEELRPRP